MIRSLLFLTRSVRYRWNHFTYSLFADKHPIETIRDKYRNRPIIICGNGPSLNETPLDDFIKTPSIGMNKIDLLFSKTNWRPSMIVCTNNLVVMQHWNNFILSNIPVYISWKARPFVPKRHRHKLRYFLSLETREFSENISLGVGSAGTVTYAALQFAYYLGANPVILFGVDHSFLCQGIPNEIVKAKGNDKNHFDPNYFSNGQKWGLPNLTVSELAYRKAKEIFEKNKKTIYDATIGGKLQVFPKISVQEARKLCKT